MISLPILNREYTIPLQYFLCIEYLKKKQAELALINITNSAIIFFEKYITEFIFLQTINSLKLVYTNLFNSQLYSIFTLKNIYLVFIILILI